MSTAVVRMFGKVPVPARPEDQYVHATELCKAAGKKWSHYAENDGTREFIQALAESTGIPVDSLIEQASGRGGGTWIHPRVAIHFGQWVSPQFAVAVTDWVLELMTTGKVELNQQPPDQDVAAITAVEVAEVVAKTVATMLQPILAQLAPSNSHPLTGTETVASRLARLLPHWNTNRKQRARITNKARGCVRRALAQEPLCVHDGSQLEFLPHMHYHLDTAILQVYREACEENEVDDFGLYREAA